MLRDACNDGLVVANVKKGALWRALRKGCICGRTWRSDWSVMTTMNLGNNDIVHLTAALSIRTFTCKLSFASKLSPELIVLTHDSSGV